MRAICFFVLPFLLASSARAACSRPIVAPASPLGSMIRVDSSTKEVAGIFPSVLRKYGKTMNCKFEFPIMPRARAELMMSRGEVDLLMGSIQVPERDAWGGEYVPMFIAEWMLISIRPDPLPATIAELIAKPGAKLYVVRGFNNGPEYMSMLQQMKKLGRLEEMKDPEAVARMMNIGRADYTFMPYATFNGALATEGLKTKFKDKMRHRTLKDIPITASGAYLSKNLPLQDTAALKDMLIQIRKNNEILNELNKIFTSEELDGTYRIKEK